jgi:hypothetical protein
MWTFVFSIVSSSCCETALLKCEFQPRRILTDIEMVPHSGRGVSHVEPRPNGDSLELYRSVEAMELDCRELQAIDDGGDTYSSDLQFATERAEVSRNYGGGHLILNFFRP